MNIKNDLIFIEHILDSINAIEEFSKNLSKEELSSSRLKRNAIVREIEIIGEAVKNISRETKEEYSDVQWKEIAGTRDKMIHHYFGIELEIVWKTIKEEIPILKKQTQEIKNDLEKEKSR